MSSSPVKTTHTQTTVKKTLVHSDPSSSKTVTTTTKTYVFTSESGEEVVLDLKDAATTRPHARKVSGSVVSSEFTASTSTFVFEYSSEGATEPTEIFVPYVHFPGGYRVTASDGHCAIEKHEGYDVIKHEHDSHAHKHRVVVERTKKAAAKSARFAWEGHSNIPVYVALGIAIVTPYLAW
ncbi:putative glycosyl hydrolase [Phytophthora cinnamomi]|uniref:putative glycosyl hydrolase n=1 Tax=Phytophthora cinnamomi TaxID=4785 RepID=UPI00355A5AEC|nr:putative glycosyl hydrolase [Phytophthora cinnamomi]